jgi:hypothetical protein
MKRLFLLIACLLLASPCWGASYYVDCNAAAGGDGSITTPWDALGDMSVLTGDQSDNTVYLKRGCTFRETLYARGSGTAGHPHTFTAYGTGADPIITGADILTTTGWTKTGGATNVYEKALTTNPGSYVLEDGVKMTKQSSTANVDSNAGSYYWASDVIYVNATGASKDPSSNGKVYETPIRATLASTNEKSYLVFDGLQIQMATTYGVWSSDSNKASNVTVKNCTFKWLPYGNSFHGDNITIQYNTFTDTPRCIEFRDIDASHCTNFIIEYNTFSNIGSATESNAGILLDSDTNADNADYHSGIIRYNVFSTVQGRAIDGFIGNSSIYYNIIKNVTTGAAGSAICLEVNGKGNTVYNNVFYECANYAIFINSDPVAGDTANVIKNNIFYSTTVNHIIGVSAGVVAGTPPTIDYNIYWMGSGGETRYQWGATDYTFTNWKTQSSGDANSKEADPQFISTANFHLLSSSPAINAGVNVSLTADYDGNGLKGAVDIGAYEYQDANIYIDQTSGSDSANGLTGTPWKTIAKVNAASLVPGANVYFKRGETWQEQLTVPSSGSSGSPITFGAYGTGAAPIITGSGSRDHAIKTDGKSYITITGLDLTAAIDSIVYLRNSDHITLSTCTIHDTAVHGIKIYLGSGVHTITGNEIYNTGVGNSSGGSGCGLILVAGTGGGNNIIQNNYFHDIGGTAGDHAIYNQTVDNIIRYNRFVPVTSGSRAFYSVSTGWQFYYNTIESVAGTQAIGCGSGSGGATVYNNTFYNCYRGLITLSGQTGVTIKNNIFSVITDRLYEIQDTTSVTSDYNVFYPNSWSTNWNSSWDTNFAGWKTTSSQDAHSINADPLFISTTNFHLKGNSPARRAGADVSLYTDFAGRPVSATPTIGAYQFYGAPKTMLVGGKFRIFGGGSDGPGASATVSKSYILMEDNSSKILVEGGTYFIIME